MRVALLTTLAGSRKEPLVAMMDRVHQGFLDGGLGEPEIRFNFGDGLIASGDSVVDRALKREGCGNSIRVRPPVCIHGVARPNDPAVCGITAPPSRSGLGSEPS